MTIADKYLELINADIDGTLGGPARAELSAFLLANLEARELHDNLRRVCKALDAIPAAEPPADLRSSILAALPPEAPAVRSVLGFAARRITSRPSATRLRYAAAFAGGLLVSALAFQFAASSGSLEVSVNQLVGTIAKAVPDVANGRVETATLDQARVEIPHLSATISLHGTPQSPVIGVAVVADRDFQIVASVDGQEIRFGGFAASPGQPDVRVGAFKHPLSGATQSVEVKVVEPVSGTVLQSSTLAFDDAHRKVFD